MTDERSRFLRRVDHLVYAVPDVEEAVARLAEAWGVRPVAGGRHPGRGTHNALLSLGPTAYLEIVGRDPDQPRPEEARWFGLDELEAPRLAAWAARCAPSGGLGDLDALVARAAAAGLDLGAAVAGSRARADGTTLTWRFTDPLRAVAGGLVPFLLDWGASPHPGASAPAGLALLDLRAEHPDPARVRALLAPLDLALPVSDGPRPRLVATLDTPRGPVELAEG